MFELVFDRFFFRAVELAAAREGIREQSDASGRLGELTEDELEELRAQIAAGAARRLGGRDARSRAHGDRGVRPPPGGLGRDRRGRAAHPPRARACAPSPSRSCRAEDPRRDGLPREALRRFEALLRRELERAQIERTGNLPPARPLGELDRALPSGPLADLAAVHRVVAQLRRRLATQGMQARGHRRHAHVDVRRTMRASLQTGGVPVVLKYRPRRPRRPEIYVLCDVSTSVTSASVFFLSVLHALHDTLPQDALVRVHRAHLRGDRHLRTRAQLQGGQRTDLQRRGRGRHLRLHRLRARVVGVPRRRSRTTCTRARP